VFDPTDLEVLQHVYEAAWARIETDHFDRDPKQDAALQAALRKWVFALSGNDPVNFEVLLEQLNGVPTWWLMQVASEIPPRADSRKST
jgi:hypothetical protein